jgi:preprotein translocase subunit YajC
MNTNATTLILYFAVLAVAFYFLIIRPQQQRQRQQRDLMSALKPGDRILTASGLFGTVTSIEGDKVKVRLAQGVEVEMLLQAVAQIVEKTSEVSGPIEPKA